MLEEIKNQYVLGNIFDWFPKIPDNSVDLLFTSVPDLEELDSIGLLEDYQNFLNKSFAEISRITKPEGFIVMGQTDRRKGGFIFPKHIEIWEWLTKTEKKWRLKEIKILIKTNNFISINLFRLTYSQVLIFTINGKITQEKKSSDFMKDIWHYPSPENKNFWNQYFCDMVVETLTKENDFVVDPFAGRGTVLKSAKKKHRNYFGAEIKEECYYPNYLNE